MEIVGYGIITMRNILFIFIFPFIALPLMAETPNEMAVKIINSQPRTGYNPIDSSAEEMARAYAFNSKMRLNWLMANDDSLSEELRISYAIHLLDNALGIHKVLRSGTKPLPKEQEMMKQRLILGSRLVELAKVEQGSAH